MTTTVSAASMNLPEECHGFYAASPSFVVRLATPFSHLELSTLVAVASRLVVVGADGSVWCNRDTIDGFHARIDAAFPAGDYRVFIGQPWESLDRAVSLFISTADRTRL